MPIDAKERLAALTDEQRQLLARRLLATKGKTAQDGPIGFTRSQRRDPADLVPLSYAQQRIWFLNQLDSSSTAWNVGRPIRLRGALDPDALTRTVNEIVRRHESLRTIFPVSGGVPAQRILPFSAFPLPPIDLQNLPAAQRGEEALRQMAAIYRQPWSLEIGPLARFTLWRLADDDHILLFLIHHIVADGWSHGLVESELTSIYRAFSASQPSPLAELPVQYADFSAWQHQWINSADYRRQIEHWKIELADLSKTALVADRADLVGSGNGVVRHVALSADLSRALKAICRREGATLFMGLMAAFAALLSRYSGQEDIVIGSPIANRNRAELENVIGCFMNPLPMRFDVSGAPSFTTLLRRVRDTSLGVYAHQDVPFDLLVRTLQPKREPGTPPLFQVMLLLQNYPWQPFAYGDAEQMPPRDVLDDLLDKAALDSLRSDLVYPVAIEAYERGNHVLCVFQYETAFTTILSRAPEHFRLLLEGAMANSDQPVGEIPLLTAVEQRRGLHDATAPARVMPLALRRFEARAAERPGATALVAGDQAISYSDLDARANQLARRLQALGVGPDARVALLLTRSPELIVALLAVLKAGGAYVPLDPTYPDERLSFMLRDSQATLLVTTASLLGERTSLVIPCDGMPIVRLDVEALSLTELERSTPRVEVAGANLAYVIYTSGSTGMPKGVQVTHESVANYTAVALDAFGLTENDRVLQFASISFDTATEEIFPCLAAGATLVLRSDAMVSSVPLFLRSCADWGITVLDLPTAYWHELTAAIARHDLPLPETIRLVILGGERARPDTAQTWQARFGSRVRLLNTYGPTEATVVTTMHDVPAAPPAGAPVEVPIGRAIPGARVFILDRHLHPVTIGAPGELHIGGSGLSRGYLGRPDLTAEKFIPNPFSTEAGERLYKTGDLARFLEDGTIQFLGRIDQQIKLRGYRIELAEIEAALRRDAAVEDAVVVLRDEGTPGQRLVAYVVARGGALASADLRRRLRESLPDYMVPATFVLLEKLPLTPSGKIDRDALGPADEPQSLDTPNPPETALQQTLASIWRELLGSDRIGIDDNFFDLGGHSLLVLQLHSRLHEAFENVPSVIDLFRYSTVRALAEHLRGIDGDVAAFAPDADALNDRADRQRQAFRRRRDAVQAAMGRG